MMVSVGERKKKGEREEGEGGEGDDMIMIRLDDVTLCLSHHHLIEGD